MNNSCCFDFCCNHIFILNEDNRGKLIQMCETVVVRNPLLLLFSRMNESCYECM
jgi:hypothetical protein